LIALTAPSTDEALLREIVSAVREHKGLRRKSPIGLLLPLFGLKSKQIVAAKGEDAAIIRCGDRLLAFAADGIRHELIKIDPRWAGYCSILVNVNDILSMNARPIAAVNVMSVNNDNILRALTKGMLDACEKFNVPMVGGHLHPDAEIESISVAMVGEVCGNRPLLSSSAEPGDQVIVICDCHGHFTPGIPYSWDCTSMKSRKKIDNEMTALLDALPFLTAGKDISNSGMLGTLAMLLEASGVGAAVDIDKIPVPEDINLIQWLTAYQGFGFVGAVKKENVNRVFEALERSNLSVSVIGKITAEKRFKIALGKAQRLLFDLSKEKITGLF
jgi:selenophosphate synthetase-related protein